MTDYPNPDPAAPESPAGDVVSPGPAGAGPQGLPAPDAHDEAMAAVERERDEFRDLLLRKSAEFDNYRRRVERERRELIEQANADLVRALLPLVDNFERALQAPAEGAGAETYRQGVELIHKQLLEILARFGVTPLDPLGADFDPHLHEAVARDLDPSRRDGEIVEVFARGYQMRDRLLRPARVRVAQS
jgi:molecular chaperone GrpE